MLFGPDDWNWHITTIYIVIAFYSETATDKCVVHNVLRRHKFFIVKLTQSAHAMNK